MRAPALLAASVLLLLAGLPGRAQEGPAVEFTTPRNLQTAIGPTRVALRVTVPPGSSAERVVLTVDGRPLATLAGPPWETTWDAGAEGGVHRLHAVLRLADGRTAEASIRTSALAIQQVEEVELVDLYAIVEDDGGTYVTGLAREDFRLVENGVPQVIDRFGEDRKPLQIAIVLDSSLSMEDERLAAAKESALRFLETLGPEDQAMVVVFNDGVQVAQPLTTDRDLLARAIEGTAARGGTALYDAVYRASELLASFPGRKVMVLLSDGRDEASNGLEPGSLHRMDEALDRALRNEVMIFALGFGKRLDTQFDFYGKESLQAILTRFADFTGGRVLFPTRPGQLSKAFADVAEDLRHQYSLAYRSTNEAHDGKWREIRLTSTKPGLKVITRKGYYASRR